MRLSRRVGALRVIMNQQKIFSQKPQHQIFFKLNCYFYYSAYPWTNRFSVQVSSIILWSAWGFGCFNHRTSTVVVVINTQIWRFHPAMRIWTCSMELCLISVLTLVLINIISDVVFQLFITSFFEQITARLLYRFF